jgi:ATP/maltotriose-dependent transcriptional regulator MalT
MPDSARTHPELLDAGRAALERADWAAARAAFTEAVEREGTPEAYQGLAEAAWWEHDEAAVFAAREKAYRLFRERGDRAAAARMAIWLATDSLEFRGEPAVANGWIQRAHRLLAGLGADPAHGWLAAWEGHLALMLDNDTARARQLAAEGAAAGRSFGNLDLEMLGLAIEGLALVSEGGIAEGTRLLDEAAAAAIAGDVRDHNAAATVLCYLMDGCSRVRDYDRAAQWCQRVQAWASAQHFEGLYSVCRPLYAVVLMWRGAWAEAEEQLTAAVREIAAFRAPMVTESIVRLAELRWRQGRWEEAAALFSQVEQEGLAQPGRAELALSLGDIASAQDLADRFLRRIPLENRIERVAGLELAARAAVAAGDLAAARACLEELRSIAQRVGTGAINASLRLVDGLIAAASGDGDGGRRALEDAVDLFQRQHAPFEAARAQLELARLLAAQGQPAAAREAAAARRAFEGLGAAREAEHSRQLIEQLEGPSAAAPAGLTPRELEILRLIGEGRSNQEIARTLVLSVRTVERHVSSIYAKLGADGKAARASAAAYAAKHGLV